MKLLVYGSLLAVESVLSLSGQMIEGTSGSIDATALGLVLVTSVPSACSFANALFDRMHDEYA